MIHDRERVAQALGGAATRRLVKKIADRLRLGRALTGSVSLRDPSEEERSAIDRLLGRRPSSGSPMVVRLADVERVLRDGGLCDKLAEAVEAVIGPVKNERRARDAAIRQWADLYASVEPEMTDLTHFREWLTALRAGGQLKRYSKGDVAAADFLLRRALTALRQLPQPATSLAEFATQITGDSHALDAGMPLSALCLSAIAQQHGREFPASAHARRRLWDIVGVVIDELSAPVLTLNLRGTDSTHIGRMLNVMADAAEPCHLTVRQLRQLDGRDFQIANNATVFVCENPSVLSAAARRLGKHCMPLICTAGQPASAAQLLLRHLGHAGCQLRYHGDFDPSGITIANMLIRRFAVEPWRMSASDYVAAAKATGPPFRRPAVEATWDDQLAAQMRLHGNSVLEERVLDALICDLRINQ